MASLRIATKLGQSLSRVGGIKVVDRHLLPVSPSLASLSSTHELRRTICAAIKHVIKHSVVHVVFGASVGFRTLSAANALQLPSYFVQPVFVSLWVISSNKRVGFCFGFESEHLIDCWFLRLKA